MIKKIETWSNLTSSPNGIREDRVTRDELNISSIDHPTTDSAQVLNSNRTGLNLAVFGHSELSDEYISIIKLVLDFMVDRVSLNTRIVIAMIRFLIHTDLNRISLLMIA